MKEPNATQIASLYTCSVTPSPSLTSIMLKHTPADAVEKKLKEEMEQKKIMAAAKEAANGFFVFVCESASVATCVLSVPKRLPVRGRLIM